MCGLFGYIGKPLSDKDILNLQNLASKAGTRGPHGWGVSWLTPEGFRSYWQLGKIGDDIGFLKSCLGSSIVVGHCRLSTTGTVDKIEELQPFSSTGVSVAHNGVVLECNEIFRKHNHIPRTENDSEAIYAVAKNTLSGKEVARTILSTNSAVLFATTDWLYLCTTSQPLWVSKPTEKDRGVFVCSRMHIATREVYMCPKELHIPLKQFQK